MFITSHCVESVVINVRVQGLLPVIVSSLWSLMCTGFITSHCAEYVVINVRVHGSLPVIVSSLWSLTCTGFITSHCAESVVINVYRVYYQSLCRVCGH